MSVINGLHEETNVIKFRVDERLFTIELNKLTAYPDTMLGRMFSSSCNIAKPNDKGEYEIYCINSEIFEVILNYYRNRLIKCPKNVALEELEEACDYLQIPFSANTLQDVGAFLSMRCNSVRLKMFRSAFEPVFTTLTNKANLFGYFDVYIIKEEDRLKVFESNSFPNNSAMLLPLKSELYDMFAQKSEERGIGVISTYLKTRGLQSKIYVFLFRDRNPLSPPILKCDFIKINLNW